MGVSFSRPSHESWRGKLRAFLTAQPAPERPQPFPLAQDPPELRAWLEAATQRLCLDADRHVSHETREHYHNAFDRFRQEGVTPELAHSRAMALLGDAKTAAAVHARQFLTTSEDNFLNELRRPWTSGGVWTLLVFTFYLLPMSDVPARFMLSVWFGVLFMLAALAVMARLVPRAGVVVAGVCLVVLSVVYVGWGAYLVFVEPFAPYTLILVPILGLWLVYLYRLPRSYLGIYRKLDRTATPSR